jgi:predicted DNA-binding transcriptional regulator YafY
MPYLIASINENNGIRQFAVSRIKSIDIKNRPGNNPKGFDLDGYIKDGNMGVTLSNSTLNFKARITSDLAFHFEEQPLSKDQSIKEVADKYYEIKCTVFDNEQFRWWILSYGENIKVLSPPSLMKEIKEKAKRMSDLY